jgi:hypothetical protein
MSGAIVLTTINPPTEGVRRIARRVGEQIAIVVGDRKTPLGWHHAEVLFLSPDEQLEAGHPIGQFAETCPWNHYARKNVGYLFAIGRRCSYILETDDDNLPYDNFGVELAPEVIARGLIGGQRWHNVYRDFTNEKIWPRGFPLELIDSSFQHASTYSPPLSVRAPVQQYLADGDPDVDAVYRLTSQRNIRFSGEPVVIGPGTYCPFNSQNTLWWPQAFPLLYLPAFVSFRMTDIWRSFVAQAILHARGTGVEFGSSTVYQQRNSHILLRDFADEIPGYLGNSQIVEVLASLRLGTSWEPKEMCSDLATCYEELVAGGFVPDEELTLLRLWIDAIHQIS